jgi:23S rRNA (cytidine1920-2'-O)/16S rRNA (cytidine1409-2'-O)-methyltransferase
LITGGTGISTPSCHNTPDINFMPPPKKKQRADKILVDRNLASNPDEARALIMAGMVLHDEKPLTKPGLNIPVDATLRLRKQKSHQWVSRGALKLEHALKEYNINPEAMIAVDIGASTGGFTDVLLHYGAKTVYAVDVGYGELAWKLQNNPQVVVLDRTNARYLTKDQVPDNPDIIVCDASFISLKTILPAVLILAIYGTYLVALIKPQFEVAKNEVGDKGIVQDKILHERVCQEIKTWLENIAGWQVIGITTSPITGSRGNVEFLIVAVRI